MCACKIGYGGGGWEIHTHSHTHANKEQKSVEGTYSLRRRWWTPRAHCRLSSLLSTSLSAATSVTVLLSSPSLFFIFVFYGVVWFTGSGSSFRSPVSITIVRGRMKGRGGDEEQSHAGAVLMRCRGSKKTAPPRQRDAIIYVSSSLRLD
jgi:hypothetical protein